jgi:hypothetical protein
MKVTRTELLQIIKEEMEAELNEFDGPYGDDADSPSLEAQMGDAILAAVQALEAGDLELARAAFPESLLKSLACPSRFPRKPPQEPQTLRRTRRKRTISRYGRLRK